METILWRIVIFPLGEMKKAHSGSLNGQLLVTLRSPSFDFRVGKFSLTVRGPITGICSSIVQQVLGYAMFDFTHTTLTINRDARFRH